MCSQIIKKLMTKLMNAFTNIDDPLTFELLIPNEVGVATYST